MWTTQPNQLPVARQPRPLVWTLVALVAAVSCSGATDATAPPAASPAITRLEVSGPDTLIIHQRSLLTVIVWNANGEVVRPAPRISFASSDSTVLTVSDSGVVSAAGRGTATVVATLGAVAARMNVVVKARVAVSSALGISANVQLTSGDTLRLVAVFTDVNGSESGPAPTTSWSSTNPYSARVDSTGLVVGVAEGLATILASTPDGIASLPVKVRPLPSQLAATVRFAHVLPGLGPLIFTSNKLSPVMLSYGESVDLAITPGDFHAQVSGLPATMASHNEVDLSVDAGQVFSIYATAYGPVGLVSADGSSPSSIPPDSGYMRLVNGGRYPVVHLLDAGAPPWGMLLQCYFDGGDFTSYYERRAGAFDLLLTPKFGNEWDSTRVSATVPKGHAITVVLTGGSPGYLSFTDR